jgi:hypothetical protein
MILNTKMEGNNYGGVNSGENECLIFREWEESGRKMLVVCACGMTFDFWSTLLLIEPLRVVDHVASKTLH